MNARTIALAVVIAGTLLGTTACTVTPGSAAPLPSGAGSAATITVTASPSATSVSAPVSPESSSPQASSPAPPSEAGTSTEASKDPGDTVSASSGVVDATTKAWVNGICTGMGNVLQELVEKRPRIADDAPLATLRQALMDYYALSSDTASTAYESSQQVDPPKVANGTKIHQAYQDFLSGLSDIFYNATLDMAGAADLNTIKSINDGVDTKITTLGQENDALTAMASGPLAQIASTLASCQKVKQLAS